MRNAPMSNPTISIVVPVYNVKDYLQECLDSLILQTMGDIEIICVDDGSTDGSSDLLDQIAKNDERIHIIHKRNSGVASARNDGMAAATGKYVMFVDSDDYISHATCEILLKVAEGSAADIVVFGGKTFPTSPWADWAFAARDITYSSDGVNALLNEQGANPLMCNKLYRRGFLEEQHATFDENLSLGEDNAFQFKLFPAAHTVVFIKDMLYFYRTRQDSAVSASFNDYDDRLAKHMDVVEAVWEYWEGRGFLPTYLVNLFAWAVTFLYNEAAHASFNTRAAVCSEFAAFIKQKLNGADPVSLIIDDRILRMHSFLSDAAAYDGTRPLVTTIINEPYDAPLSRTGIESILAQSVQQIEMIILLRENTSDRDRMLTDSIMQADCRVKQLATNSVQVLDNEANGSYLIVSTSHEHYDADAFRAMLEGAGELQPLTLSPDTTFTGAKSDLIAIKDAVGLLEVKDPFTFHQPEPEITLTPLSSFPASCYDAHIGSALTLFACNKLVSRQLFSSTRHIADDFIELIPLIALCTQKAQAVRTIGLPRFAFKGIPLGKGRSHQSVSLDIDPILAALPTASMTSSGTNAVIADLETARKDYLATIAQLSIDSEEQPPKALVDLACTAGAATMTRENKTREDITCLWQTIERIERSTSLRIGRMMTSFPRKMISRLQKLRSK